jgi:NCAIR mutase (PurE)-related protein
MEKKTYGILRAITWPIRKLFSILKWLVESIFQVLKITAGFVGVVLFGLGVFGPIVAIPTAIQYGWEQGLFLLVVSLASGLIGRPLVKRFLGVDPIFLTK